MAETSTNEAGNFDKLTPVERLLVVIGTVGSSKRAQKIPIETALKAAGIDMETLPDEDRLAVGEFLNGLLVHAAPAGKESKSLRLQLTEEGAKKDAEILERIQVDVRAIHGRIVNASIPMPLPDGKLFFPEK
ncbi:MAG: hypothetical protein WC843_05030 [Candidatus Gracilibacteria bacterium]|jgi:hypothetical protein